jgi:hypothetical protein
MDLPRPSEPQRRPLYVQVEPLRGPIPAGGTFFVLWLDENGKAGRAHHAHPARTLMDLRAGDIIVVGRTPHRFVQARVFAWRVVPGEPKEAPWRPSLWEAIEDSVAADARHRERIAQWWAGVRLNCR